MKYSFTRTTAATISFICATLLTGTAGAKSVPERFHNSTELHAIESPLPQYPRSAIQQGLEGWALVEFTVMPDGTVTEPVLEESTNDRFGEATMEVIEDWKFIPVVEGETVVPVRSALRFRFVGQSR